MAAPATISTPLEFYRGDAWSQTLRFWQDTSGGTPLDLHATFGPTITAQCRVSEDTATSTSFTVDDSTTGQIKLSLTGTQTAALQSDQYVFDVQATGGTLSPVTIVRGVMQRTKDVTRP